MKRDIFGFGLAQVAVCGLAADRLIWLGSGFRSPPRWRLGLPLALSSTAQVLPLLQSSGRLRTPFGERAFAILLFQDLSIIAADHHRRRAEPQRGETGGPPGWQLALYTVARDRSA